MGRIPRTLLLLAVFFGVQSANAVRRRLASAPQRSLAWSAPDYSIYHRQDDLLREVEVLVKANPGFMKLDVYTESEQDYKASVKVVTVEPGGFSNRHDEKVRVLLDFGEHGRELISSELGLLLLRTLADPGRLSEVFPGGDPNQGRELKRVLEGTVMKILPMENEAGRRLVEAGKLCERKNGRGVDPNRNWLVDWGKKEPDYDPNEEFPGAHPFSEPEVKILKQLATDFKPQVWLNIHSGMEAMLAPWDHKAEVAVEVQPTVAMLEVVKRDVMANTSCVVGSGGKEVGYLAHGTATDYMYEVLRVPIASTWEIYGDFEAHFDDCFRMFNPLDEAGFKDVLQRWLRAILRLIELLPTHPALKDIDAWSTAAKQTAREEMGASKSPSSGSSSTSAAAAEGGGSGGASAAQKGREAGDAAAKNGGGAEADATAPGNGQRPGVLAGGAHITTTTTSTTTTGGTKADAGSSSSPAGGSSASSSSIGSGSGSGSGGTGTQAPLGSPLRLTVVTPGQTWGSPWRTEVFSGLLAVAGLAVVGVMAFRCLPKPSAERRAARGDDGVTV